jgi:hypothetical protein
MRVLLAGLLVLAGCGTGGASGTGRPAEVASPAPTSRPALELPPPRKSELPEVVRALPKDAAFYAYLDGERFRASPLSSIYRSAVSEDFPTARVKRECGFDPLEALNAAALAGQVVPGSGPQLVAVVDIDRGSWAVLECLKKLGGRADASSGGVVLDPDWVALEAGRFVVVGDPPSARLVAARIAQKLSSELPAPMRETLDEHPGAILVATGRLGQAIPESPFDWARLHVESSAARFLLRIEADTTDTTAASSYATALDPSRLGPFDGRSDLPRIRVTTRGNRILWELSVDGGPNEQAYRLGVASALAVSSVRRYIGEAKTAEAKNTVGQIAKDLVAYATQLPPARMRFPPSAPLTPKQVPSGSKTPVTDADWSHPTWKAIGFSLTDPVYYSYEIVTAPGGKKAIVRATGDLDGDGARSHFSLELRIDAKGEVSVSPQMLIEDELE